MNGLRREEGSAVIIAMMILIVILGIGVALLATATGQQRSAFNQQSSESAFSVAEAALNAQVYQLSLQWPTSQNMPAAGYPASCNAASNGASYCPAASDLSTAYPTGSQICPNATSGDAWSNSGTTNGWTTYVRDAGQRDSSTQSLFNSLTEKTQMLPYDASGSGAVWVRAAGTVNCHTVVLVSKVSEQLVALNFPQTVLSANGFEISDNGSKTVLNTADVNGNQSQVSIRCTNLGGYQPVTSQCAQYSKPEEVSPGPSWSSPPTASPTLSPAALQTLKAQANANGTYFSGCPTLSDSSQLAGSVVYIEGGNSQTPCNIKVTGNGTVNSSTSPGLIVLVNGTLTFGGNFTYYGVIYGVNAQNVQPPAPGSDIVTLGGTSTVVGGIDIDGLGTVNLGSSGNGVNCSGNGNGNNKCGDLQFAQSAFPPLTAFAGAAGAPNSFRQLPAGQ
jgi:Tfp pilus assembly protein PilX